MSFIAVERSMMKSPEVISLDQALDLFKTGQNVVTAMAAAEPQKLFSQLHQIDKSIENLTFFSANPSEAYPCFSQEDLMGRISFQMMFLTHSVRKLIGNGLIDYVPQHLSRWIHYITSRGRPDIFWGSCSLPDDRGFVSLGPNCCYESEALRQSRLVVLEMNPNIPCTFGATHVPVSQVDYFVQSEKPLQSIPHNDHCDEIDETIASYIAELVADGSTIQLGIGSIPNAVGRALASKKHLGIHTEMINNTMIDLVEQGVVDGSKKSIWPGKVVGAFALGNEHLYKFLHNNPSFEFQPASVVNDPVRIGRNHLMISINTAVEVDFSGQVCSESVGHRELSGIGGAADTHIGAQRSSNGRGIIAVRSLAKNGASKIVAELKPGAKVSIGRNDVDTIITEYGVCRLADKSVSERILGLIGIAHPDHRDELTDTAKRLGYL
ncbi:MAG: acetyl-CoA hydrolase/transferase family protein [Pseudobacteriovorax sp.]|nr:acetyl-CoA hydrolase/transferase family protein [Pseudobacteriovorax sp.]